MAHNWVRPPPPSPQDFHHGPSSAIAAMGAPLRYPPATLQELIYFTNLQPPPFLDPHPFFIPYIHNMPYHPAPHPGMMRPYHTVPLYYQWQDVPDPAGSAPTRSLVPVYLNSNEGAASARRRQARLVQTVSHAPTPFPAIQGHGDESFQENAIARPNMTSQPPWNEVSSWISQERWNELGLPSGYNRQQAGNEASSRISHERWNDIRLPQGHIGHQQTWNEFSSWISQERWNELGLPSGFFHQQAVNDASARMNQERCNELGLPSGNSRQQEGNETSSRISQAGFNEIRPPPGFNQVGRNEVRPETYSQRGAIPKHRPSQQVDRREEEVAQGGVISHATNQQAKAGEDQAEAAFQGIPMPQYRSGHQERQESLGQPSNTQLETVETSIIWPLLPQEKANVRNFNCKTSSSIFLRNTSEHDTEAAAVTYLSTEVEVSLKTYASAILSLAAPPAPPLVTPVKEATAAGNAKVIKSQKTKDTLGATDGPKNVSSGSDNKYPLEPDSFFYTANIDVLMNYVGNVRPKSRMKYTENFVRPKMASAYSHKSIYDKNHPEDLPSELPVSDMYVLEQRLKNGKAAIKLCKDLGIDDEVLEKFGEEDGYSIYRVCHYPQSHPLWLESHPPDKSPVPCQADIDEAFEHLGPDRKPGDLLNEFIDKLMDYNAKTRDHVNPPPKGQRYKSDPTIVEGVEKGKKSWVGRERKDKK